MGRPIRARQLSDTYIGALQGALKESTNSTETRQCLLFFRGPFLVLRQTPGRQSVWLVTSCRKTSDAAAWQRRFDWRFLSALFRPSRGERKTSQVAGNPSLGILVRSMQVLCLKYPGVRYSYSGTGTVVTAIMLRLLLWQILHARPVSTVPDLAHSAQ